jgi:hypothetical protein
LQSHARSPPRSRTGALARQARSMCSSASRACWAARSASSWPVTCASGTLAGVIPPRAPARCPGRAARAACTVDPQAAGLAAAAYLRVLDADASILGHPAGKRRRPVLGADHVLARILWSTRTAATASDGPPRWAATSASTRVKTSSTTLSAWSRAPASTPNPGPMLRLGSRRPLTAASSSPGGCARGRPLAKSSGRSASVAAFS